MTAPTREEFSSRLLRGSVKKYYEPVVDIDWEAELDPDKFFLPPKVVSLYGTPIWDAMTREQQIELSRQELVNTLSAGIWFENILNQAILRKIMHEDPTVQRDPLRADGDGRRDPPHGHVRQGDLPHRRQADPAAMVAASGHQRTSPRLQGFGAVGRRADR